VVNTLYLYLLHDLLPTMTRQLVRGLLLPNYSIPPRQAGGVVK
jgi:hypothetical protein